MWSRPMGLGDLVYGPRHDIVICHFLAILPMVVRVDGHHEEGISDKIVTRTVAPDRCRNIHSTSQMSYGL